LYIYHGLGPYKLSDLTVILGEGTEILEHREGAKKHREISLDNHEAPKRLEVTVGKYYDSTRLKDIEDRQEEMHSQISEIKKRQELTVELLTKLAEG